MGVGPPDVERLLPIADEGIAAARLDAAQPGRGLPPGPPTRGQLGGMLKGVAGPRRRRARARRDQLPGAPLQEGDAPRSAALSEPLHLLSGRGGVLARHRGALRGDLLADGGACSPRPTGRRRILWRVLVGGVGGAPAPGRALRRALAARRAGAGRRRAGHRRSLRRPRHRRDRSRPRLDPRSGSAPPIAATPARPSAGATPPPARQRASARRRRATRRRRSAIAWTAAPAWPLASVVAMGPRPAATSSPRTRSPAPGKARCSGASRTTLDRGDAVTESATSPAPTPPPAPASPPRSPPRWWPPRRLGQRGRASQARALVLVEHEAEHRPRRPSSSSSPHADNLVKRAMIQKGPGGMADQAAHMCKLKGDLGIRGARFCAGRSTCCGQRASSDAEYAGHEEASAARCPTCRSLLVTIVGGVCSRWRRVPPQVTASGATARARGDCPADPPVRRRAVRRLRALRLSRGGLWTLVLV